MSAHTHTHHEHDPPPKATLFCPTCGHESAPTGDWAVREADRREASDGASGDEGTASREADRREASARANGGAVYECPVCGTDVARRGRSEVAVDRRGAETPADD
ncbi:MAG: hypothetical protein ABEJ26_10610 [Halosimplex sp.]